MRSFWLFASGTVLGVILSGVAYSYHFVMTNDGFVVVSKPQSSLSDIYADIRDWSLQDWTNHPELARAMVADGRSDLVSGSVTEGVVDQLLPSLGKEKSASNPLEQMRH